jgi:hypothetical protein
MNRLLLLVDNRDYIRTNCYQRQLAATLEKCFEVTMVSAREMRLLPWLFVQRFDKVLSVLRLRTLDAMLPTVSRLLRGRPVYIYEQDVWQAFIDDSPWRGAYQRIAAQLNVAKFLVTSQWWTDQVAAQDLPVRFVRMGMLPELCDAGSDWSDRPIRMGFQGTLHPHRRAFYKELNGLGLNVDVLPSQSYERYLENLHRMRIYIHTEAAPWTVNGVPVPRNALWIKETEVAARGTFAIRDHEDEAAAYGINELPAIRTFHSVGEIPDIVASIEAMPPRERRDCMIASAETMRGRDDWMTVVRAMEC